MNNEGEKNVPKRVWVPIITSLGILVSALIGYIVWSGIRDNITFDPDEVKLELETGVPELETAVVLEKLDHVWDIAFAPDEILYFSERGGDVSVVKDGAKQIIGHPSDVMANGEGGMLGLTLDPDFATNRHLYTCFNTASDVRLVRWTVNAETTALGDRVDLITNMPRADSGRHSGCRPRFGPDGYLWVATGDAAQGTNPQDSESLGGKILRINRDGDAAPDNFGEPFDPRIYSYGHRNGQGIAFYPRPRAGVIGYSIEHGPGKDDELNPLAKGNFGWDPVPGYNEGVPMTDTAKYPGAVPAAWSSGDPSIAPSGGTILTGTNWKGWNGALAMAVLRDQHLRILTFDASGKLVSETKVLAGSFGRLRSAVMGPGNILYLTTDNGGGTDQIIKVTPN